MLESAPWMVNETLVWVLTYLWYGINQSRRIGTPKIERHVEVQMNKVAMLEFVGLVFDTGIILEDELEDGRRASLDKIDKYFYETISSLFGNNSRLYIITFQVSVSVHHRRRSAYSSLKCLWNLDRRLTDLDCPYQPIVNLFRYKEFCLFGLECLGRSKMYGLRK